MILVYPDSKLRKKTSQITRIDDSLKKTLGQLEKDLLGSDLGVGLAAPQIGQGDKLIYKANYLGGLVDQRKGV